MTFSPTSIAEILRQLRFSSWLRGTPSQSMTMPISPSVRHPIQASPSVLSWTFHHPSSHKGRLFFKPNWSALPPWRKPAVGHSLTNTPTTPLLWPSINALPRLGGAIPLLSVFTLPWQMPLMALALPSLLFRNLVALAILPPPTASRHPDPTGIDAESLSSRARVPSSGGYSHPDRSSTRGFPHPIPYEGVSYYPFTPFNCGGHKCHVPFNGGDIPFPVPHSIQHGGGTFTSLGRRVPSAGVPSFVFGGAAVPGDHGLGGYLHAPSSVASSFGASSSLLRPLPHQDARSSSASDVSQSFGFQGQTVALPDITPVPPVDLPGVPTPSQPASMPSSSTRPEPFKLVEIKDAKAYLDNCDLIQYYLRIPDFSTGCLDGVLKMDPSNAEASRVWEGQICLSVKDGSLCFLFEKKGDLFHGRGFKMLAALNQHCHPDIMSNAFSSLLSLFNEVQGDSEPILEYRS